MAEFYELFALIAVPCFNTAATWLLLRRRRSVPRTLLPLALALVLAIVLSQLPMYDRHPAFFIVVPLPCFVAAIYCFEGSFWQKTFTVWCVLNLSVLFCFATSPLAQTLAPYGSDAFYAWQMLFMLVLYAAELLIDARFFRDLFPRLFEVKGRVWILYTAGALLARQVLRLIVEPGGVVAITMPPRLGDMGLYGYYIIILVSVWCFTSTCLSILVTFRRVRADYEAKRSNEALSAARSHYEALSVTIDEARVLRHDIRHTLSTVLEMAKKNGDDDILQFLSLEEDIADAHIRFCAHGVADALLNWYARRFKAENIRFDARVDIPSDVPVEGADLCALLGNLLENAYEGCLTAPQDARFALVNAHTELGMLALTVENSFDGQVKLSGGEIQSRKKGGGQGMRSVQAVCEKYGGDFLPSYTRETFTALALLNWLT
jgi:hypothetical protein